MRAMALAMCLGAAGLSGAAAQTQTGPADGRSAVETPAARTVSLGDVYLERSFVAALDDRCGFFRDDERAALDAARYQARNALLRGGAGSASVTGIAARAAQGAGAADCEDDEIHALAGDVRSAFTAYQALRRMEFPGDQYDWSADRTPLGLDSGWAAIQQARTDIGLAATTDGLRLVVTAPHGVDGLVSAIIHVRDPALESRPFDATLGGLLPAPPHAEWARFTPPEHGSARIWASDRLTGERAAALSGPGFVFPDAAIIALAAADPRETARIDFRDANGAVRDRLYVEIGDFAAALGFLQATRRSSGGAAEAETASLR